MVLKFLFSHIELMRVSKYSFVLLCSFQHNLVNTLLEVLYSHQDKVGVQERKIINLYFISEAKMALLEDKLPVQVKILFFPLLVLW